MTALQANWAFSDGNQFAQDYSPQNLINSSNVQNLGITWLAPMPGFPPSLLSVSSTRIGVDTTPLIVNGSIYAVTQEGQVIALNAANGNQIWNVVLPLQPNSTAGLGVSSLNLHFHQGEVTFTSAQNIFGGTPTYWISAPDFKVYAINALTGKYEMNFSIYGGVKTIDGNDPTSSYAGLASNLVIDTQRGIMITSATSTSNSIAARCFFRGWNILVNPPKLMWTAFCSPPQPNSNVPLNPNWDLQQVNNMTGAQIFYPGPTYNAGGTIPASGVVDLKTLSAAQLNSTLYNDWGQSFQSAACLANDGGQSTGAVGQGWGGSWVVDQKTGFTYVNTGNRAPYVGSCNPGPDLWASAVMALNDQSGQWVWGFQTSAHDEWDYDCSWYQGLGNETINGATTEVLFKTCKNGYVYELNAANGKMIWAWTPPTTILPRCAYCFMQNPLNRTQMTNSFASPGNVNFIADPSELAGFESTAAFNPAANMIYVGSHNVPAMFQYVALNSSNYGKISGINTPGGQPNPNYAVNATVEAVNAATGQMVWSHNIPTIGFRGGLMSSGNVVFAPLASGDVLMLNAQTGATIKDLFTGGPMDVPPAIGATQSGTEEVILTVGSGGQFGPAAVPGDIVALQLQAQLTSSVTSLSIATSTVTSTATTTTTVAGAGGAASTVTTTATTTVAGAGGAASTVTKTTTIGAGQTATVTSTLGGQTVTVSGTSTGFGATTVYGIAAVAAIFIIATGYLAMRGRKPA
ncbi:MAG: PQQ-binding-like beta-propeller repeat protein, partial [Thaumarchaeota archaeon]|nr:PQQ-binding-like beta-propeller repeat protein [Nitrososphaerota archaeon]